MFSQEISKLSEFTTARRDFGKVYHEAKTASTQVLLGMIWAQGGLVKAK